MKIRNWLPGAFTAPIAAKLLKTTPDLLAELTAAGAIAAVPCEGWRRYSRTEIERVLGRELTVAEWLAADREHDRRRAIHKRYNLKRAGRAALTAKGAA
jgi:hypothetical protein